MAQKANKVSSNIHIKMARLYIINSSPSLIKAQCRANGSARF